MPWYWTCYSSGSGYLNIIVNTEEDPQPCTGARLCQYFYGFHRWVVSVEVVSVGPSVPIGPMSSAFPGTAAGGSGPYCCGLCVGQVSWLRFMQTATGGSCDVLYIYITRLRSRYRSISA